MQLSTKARYALRAMLELASHYGKGSLQLKEIARRQEISEKYLEQIMYPLRVKGFVYTQKGSQGGFFLAKPPEEITVYDIADTMEDSLCPVACVNKTGDCKRLHHCALHDVWANLNNTIVSELKSLKLSDLAKKHEKLAFTAVKQPEYQI
ncbi:MAG: Rrf2 family transcriptional regulator [Bacillota bacterium]